MLLQLIPCRFPTKRTLILRFEKQNKNENLAILICQFLYISFNFQCLGLNFWLGVIPMSETQEIDLSQFEKGEYISRGEFGEVFRIREKATGTIFAAKIAFHRLDDHSSRQVLINICREINCMAKLDHPAVIKFSGYSKKDFHEEPKPVIVMEYAERRSLNDVIENEIKSLAGDWDLTKKLKCIFGIASGMHYLNSNKIVHRDLKTTNILITAEYLPKISDFGLSKEIHSQESMSYESAAGFKGTHAFSAPEIFQNLDYSEKSDVYSFALIVYHMMTLQPPFARLKNEQIRDEVLKNHRPSLDPHTLPTCYSNLIQRCWAQHPDERPTFQEIIDEICQYDNNPFLDGVDENEYFDYVDSLNENSFEFHKSIKPIKSMKLTSEDKSLEADALNDQANRYYKGDGLEVNKENACKLYKKAAELGNVKAMNNYGIMLEHGDGIPVDKQEACRYYKMAADKELPIAMFNYGNILANGDGITKNLKEAITYLERAAKKGEINAMCRLGNIYLQGEGVDVDEMKAYNYYKMAADKGDLNAMNNYAYMLLNGKGVEKDKNQAAEYYKNAAEKGNVTAMFNYANILTDDEIEQNLQLASHYYKMAADKGHIDAMKNYGYILINGEGIEHDKEEALKYYKMAIDAGDMEASELYQLLDED